MARPRKPTALHLLQGSEQNHPERMKARANEPQPAGGIGPCPEKLGAAIAEAWDYIVSCAAPGVFTSMDRASVMLAAKLLAEFFNNPPEFSYSANAQLEKLLSKFGMNPADRSKIIVPKDKKADNPFAKFRAV